MEVIKPPKPKPTEQDIECQLFEAKMKQELEKFMQRRPDAHKRSRPHKY